MQYIQVYKNPLARPIEIILILKFSENYSEDLLLEFTQYFKASREA